MYREERDVLEEEKRERDECDMGHGGVWYSRNRETDCCPRRSMVATGGKRGRG